MTESGIVIQKIHSEFWNDVFFWFENDQWLDNLKWKVYGSYYMFFFFYFFERRKKIILLIFEEIKKFKRKGAKSITTNGSIPTRGWHPTRRQSFAAPNHKKNREHLVDKKHKHIIATAPLHLVGVQNITCSFYFHQFGRSQMVTKEGPREGHESLCMEVALHLAVVMV